MDEGGRPTRQHGDPVKPIAVGPLDVDTRRRHELLGMGTTWSILDHGGRPIGGQAGKQYASLHLGAGHRQPVFDAPEAPAVDGQRCESTPVSTAGHRRPHGPQRLQYPAHGSPSDRRIAVQRRREPQSGQHPGQQADARPGVAHVEIALSRAEPATADAEDLTAIRTLLGVDPGAEGFDNGPGAGNVTAITEAMDGRLPIGQGRQHQDPVGDGLVARHPGAPPERASGLHDHRTSHRGGTATRRCVHARGAVVGRYPLAVRPPHSRSDWVASTIRSTTPRSPSAECAISRS